MSELTAQSTSTVANCKQPYSRLRISTLACTDLVVASLSLSCSSPLPWRWARPANQEAVGEVDAERRVGIGVDTSGGAFEVASREDELTRCIVGGDDVLMSRRTV
jgi:hypothetical protein